MLAVQAELELLRSTLELLLGFELDEETAAELELLATDELLAIALDENTTTELELDATDELLGVELDEDTATELELGSTTEELLGGKLELLLRTASLDEERSTELEPELCPTDGGSTI